MKVYKRLFDEAEVKPKLKKIKGEFGAGGFLAKLSTDDLINKFGSDINYIMMNINSELLTIADSGKGASKLLNKLSDIRVDDDEYRGKFSIKYPYGVHKNKSLLSLYQKITAKHLNNI